jgi:hypothetical protein
MSNFSKLFESMRTAAATAREPRLLSQEVPIRTVQSHERGQFRKKLHAESRPLPSKHGYTTCTRGCKED